MSSSSISPSSFGGRGRTMSARRITTGVVLFDLDLDTLSDFESSRFGRDSFRERECVDVPDRVRDRARSSFVSLGRSFVRLFVPSFDSDVVLFDFDLLPFDFDDES